MVLNAPVDSMIYSAPQEAHSILAGSLSLNILTGLPLTIRCWLPASIVPGKWPCTESYRAVYAIYSILRLRRFMPQSSNLSGFWEMILKYSASYSSEAVDANPDSHFFLQIIIKLF